MKLKSEQAVELFFNLPPRSNVKRTASDPVDHAGHAQATSKTDTQVDVAHPSVELIWTWLAEIPDPEIPVISLVDLGIIRQVKWQGDLLIVTITPTYSGCPATRVIQGDIEQHLLKCGITALQLQSQLTPVWTTDWISEAGREKLQHYGIAPPQQAVSAVGNGTTGKRVICPRCESSNTRKVSQFGSTPCKASYQCNACLEPFEYFKCL